MQTLPSTAEMERAYKGSDPSYDGIFFLGVRSTGVFCRPSCGARKPMPKNVEYFATPREAVFAGYRPCKRCNPLAAIGEPPEWAGRLLRAIEENPSRRIPDAVLRSMEIDPSRARRFFLKNYGMTFQAYCRGRRLGKAFEQIRTGGTLDDAALGHGYESHSGFRDAFSRTFGVPPGKADSAERIVVAWVESPLGPLIAGATAGHLVFLEFTDRRMLEAQVDALRRHFKLPIVPGENPVLELLKRELHGYFAGTLRKFQVPVSFAGSDFQHRVWSELLKIPYGGTISYEQLAERVGSPRAQRAVGHSNGLNRIAIVIPCHRVVNKSGELGGYGGGIWRKRLMLELERGPALPSHVRSQPALNSGERVSR